MQTIMIAGNVGKDAELRQTPQGESVLGFSVAVSNGKDKPATWYDCSVWGKRADSLKNYITKGTSLAITGRPTAREYQGKVYLGVSVDQLSFLGGKRSESQAAQGRPSSGDYDDVIPFAPEFR